MIVTIKHRWFFRLKILVLVSLYSVLLFTLFSFINQQVFYVSQGVLVLLAGFIILCMLALCEKQMNTIEQFFQATSHEDFSQKYQIGSVGESLANAMNDITQKLERNRNIEQAENSFLKTILRQAPVAILVFDERERITLFNQMASKTLSIKAPETLESLTASFIEFPPLLRDLKTNQTKLHKISREGVAYSFKFSANQLLLANKQQTLVTIENIGKEISQAEYQAWRNLIGVLTHEIMNSITPIVSLADNCRDIISQDNLLDLPIEILTQDMADTQKSLDTIVNRSQGIMDFVDGYRQLSKIPPPNLQSIELQSTLEGILLLQKEKLANHHVQVDITVQPKTLTVFADKQHFEQMLLNIINNAVDASINKSEPTISISAQMKREHIIVSIKDNGIGISPEVIQHIFTPFFTTKRHGTGIGMTLSRQIMHAHGGQMSVNSVEGNGTTIDLIF